MCTRHANYFLLFQSLTGHGEGTIADLHNFTAHSLQILCWPCACLHNFQVKKQTSSKKTRKGWSPKSRALQTVTQWLLNYQISDLRCGTLAVVIFRGTSLFQPCVSGVAVLFQSFLCNTQGHTRLICATKSVPWNTGFLFWLANLSDSFENAWIMNTAATLVE